jgi:hypothetical protein
VHEGVVRQHVSTGKLIVDYLDHNLISEQDLLYLETKMRSIIFLSEADISLKNLTGRIARKRPYIRSNLNPLHRDFLACRTKLFIGLSITPADKPIAGGTAVGERVATPVGTRFPPGPVDSLVTDSYYADLYFNGMVWHFDTANIAKYQAASEQVKDHIRKCADIRVLGAIRFVRALHGRVIVDSRLGLTSR